VAFILDGTAANYISQPMLCFSSAIGAGNYSRPSGEIVNCESLITIQEVAGTVLADDDKILNLEALSNGKIPKGCKAIHSTAQVVNSSIASDQGVRWGSVAAVPQLLCQPIVNNIYQTNSGTINCDANGDVYQTVTEAGATLSGLYQYVQTVQLR